MFKKIKNIPGLHDIIEITYAYDIDSDVSWFNTTLFQDFLGVKRGFDILETKEIFKRKIISIYDMLSQVSGSLEQSSGLDQVVIGYIGYIDEILKIVSLGFDFEVQKYYPKYNIENEYQILEKIEVIEIELFGTKVIDNEFETSRGVFYLEKRFEGGKGCGSKESCNMLYNKINELKELNTYKKHIAIKKIETKKVNVLHNNIQIPRSKYIKIFMLVFKLYGIEKKVFVDSRSSVYDSPDGLCFPEGENYDHLGLNRTLALIAHEVECHYIVLKNSKLIFKESHIRGKRNLFREEGLARLVEDLLRVKDMNDIDITLAIPSILLSEVFSGRESLEVIHAYRELRGLTDYEGSVHSFLRSKRNYSRYLPGVQHKDVTYSRGKFMVRDYLKEGGNFKALFYAKVDFEDMQRIEETISQKQKDSLTYPKFIAQKLLNSIEGNDESMQQIMEKKLPYVDREDYDFSLTSKQETIYEELLAMIQPYLEN